MPQLVCGNSEVDTRAEIPSKRAENVNCSFVWKLLGSIGRRSAVAIVLLAGLAIISLGLLPRWVVQAQGGSKVASVDPTSGKVNDQVTVAGTNLGKAAVVGIYLSDDKNDYKATIVDQEADKVVIKVPEVKAGDYNVSIQVGQNLLIQPVHFTVQE